jgi:hypothetical protein
MQMKPLPVVAGFLAISLAIQALSAEDAADSLTKLPLPMAGAPLVLFDNPNRLDAVPVCKSSSTMNFYTARSGMVSAAVSWYAAHLSGFKHVHGMGSGRSQDTFYNAGGTLIVSITGEPGAEGQDTKVQAVIYGTIQPGVTDKVITGMNSQTTVCK